MAAFVCSGRSLPKVSHGSLKLSEGTTSISASHSPTSIATKPQMIVAAANLRTIASS